MSNAQSVLVTRLVVVAAAVVGATFVSLPAALATPPQDVTITIDETFHAPPATPTVTGAVTASGGVFGTEATGTLASVAFKPVGWPGRGVAYPFRDHLFVYTATDEYVFADGTFLITFEASCNLTSIDFETWDTVAACAGNWRVNGGTGSYSRLKGVGTFTEVQSLDYAGAGTGTVELRGTVHAD